MSLDELRKALKALGITKGYSLNDVKSLYRNRVKEANDKEIKELSQAYKIILNFIENYPFEFSEEEFFKAFPEERLKRRIWHDPLWEKK